jgi:hypothetical protein
MSAASLQASDEWGLLHYATGILMGIASRHGVIDVVIYHNGIRVRIERVRQQERFIMVPDNDIVERLRKQAGWHIDNQKMVTGPLLDEAADEIERLRAQVVSLQSSLDAGPPRRGKKTPNALEDP